MRAGVPILQTQVCTSGTFCILVQDMTYDV